MEARRLRERAWLDGIPLGSIRAASPTEIRVDGVPPDRDAEFRRLADDRLAGYERVSAAGGVHRYRLRPDIEQARRDETVRQARLTIARRIEAFGVTEPIIARHGAAGDEILVQLPGVVDVDGAKAVIRSTGVLELNLIEAGPAASRAHLLETTQGVLPSTLEVVPGDAPAGDGPDVFYLVRRTAPISGRDLRHARPTVDEFNRPAIGFSLNRDGARSFAALMTLATKRTLHARVGVVSGACSTTFIAPRSPCRSAARRRRVLKRGQASASARSPGHFPGRRRRRPACAFFSTRSFHAVRSAPARVSSSAAARRMWVAPMRPQPPATGTKVSGASPTNIA